MRNNVEALAEGVTLPPIAARRAIRLAAGVSQSELARALGVGRSSVVRWELGTVEPQGDKRRRYAGALRTLSRVGSDA